MSQPASALEEDVLQDHYDCYYYEHGGISPPYMRLRHIVEVHAVPAGDGGHAHEDDRDRGEGLHRYIQAIALHREEAVEGAGQEVAVGVYAVGDAHYVVVHVLEIDQS